MGGTQLSTSTDKETEAQRGEKIVRNHWQPEGGVQTDWRRSKFSFGVEEMSWMHLPKLQGNQIHSEMLQYTVSNCGFFFYISQEIQMQITDMDITMFTLGSNWRMPVIGATK